MSDALIEFLDVTKKFDNRIILNRVNLRIFEKDVTTLIGKSGTGKSVLLKHMIGLLSPDSGTILFRGKPVDKMTRAEKESFHNQFSYCFQNNALFDSLTVFENIALPLQQTSRLSRKVIEQKVMEKMEQMELSDVPNKFPAEISGGMQKRVALARALIVNPKIVLFDEPTTGQDPIRKNAILGMIAQNQKKFGFTTIMVSHEIPDVFFISDRILVLYDGKIIFQGSYKEIDNLNHPIVDEFVKSLEGFKDELTGLDSKKSFDRGYQNKMAQNPHESVSFLVLQIEDLDKMDEMLGTRKTQEIIQALGENVNRRFGLVGLSTRIRRDQIGTILTNTNLDIADQMLISLGEDLKKRGLAGMKTEETEPSKKNTLFSISAGLTRGEVGENVKTLSEKAHTNIRTLVRFSV